MTRRSTRRLTTTVAAAAATLTLMGCGGGGAGKQSATAAQTRSKPAVTQLQRAAAVCRSRLHEDLMGERPGMTAKKVLVLGDSGRSLTVTGAGLLFGDRTTVDGLLCVLSRTGATDALKSQVQQTTAMMGRQSQSYGEHLKVSWSYQGGQGASAVFTEG